MDELDLADVTAGGGCARFVLGSVALVLAVGALASRRRLPAVGQAFGVLDRLAEALLAYERWVVDALIAAAAALPLAAAWTADVVDRTVLGAPADALARPFARAAAAARPVLGAPLVAVFWGLVAVLAVLCVGHGLWPAP